MPAWLTISLISSFEISVNPNALKIKYMPITIPIITINDIVSFKIDFFASLDNGLIVSLPFISHILYNFFINFMLILHNKIITF